MARITVRHRDAQAFDIDIRGMRLLSDEPVALGGEDEGPTPTELMVAGLAACAAEEGLRHLSQMGLPFESLQIEADFAWDARTERVASVSLAVSLPSDLSEAQVQAVERAMLACPARKMLTEPPSIEYEFSNRPAKTAR
jgi:putative redox protein